MLLKEVESKELLSEYIATPKHERIISREDKLPTHLIPCVVKAQIFKPNRLAKGAIKFANTEEELQAACQELLGKTIDEEQIEDILVEEQVQIKNELYISITFSTRTRSIILTINYTIADRKMAYNREKR